MVLYKVLLNKKDPINKLHEEHVQFGSMATPEDNVRQHPEEMK
jgi:hypothetical protein